MTYLIEATSSPSTGPPSSATTSWPSRRWALAQASLKTRRKWSVFYGTVIGGVLRFLARYIIGAVVWGEYMPDEFFGMTMTSTWFSPAL